MKLKNGLWMDSGELFKDKIHSKSVEIFLTLWCLGIEKGLKGRVPEKGEVLASCSLGYIYIFIFIYILYSHIYEVI